MESSLTLLQVPLTPRLALFVMALPILFLMVAALVGLVSIGGRRAWRLLFVIVFVPIALLLGAVGFFSVSRVKSLKSHVVQRPEGVVGRPELEISREIAELERRAADLKRLRERLKTLEESGQNDAASSPIVAPANVVEEVPDTTGDKKTIPAGAADVDAPVAASSVTAEAEKGDDPPKTETSEEPIAGAAPEQSEALLSAELSSGAAEDSSHQPAWVGASPQWEGQVHITPITIGPYTTLQECRESAELEVKQAVARYDDWYLSRYGGAHRTLVRAPQYNLDLNDPDYCYHQLRESRLLDEKMHILHVRLEFPPSYRQQLDACWKETLVARRLTQVAVLSGAVLTLLAMLYLYLKLDVATRGSYTRRLQCGVAVAILALVATSVLLVRWIPWL